MVAVGRLGPPGNGRRPRSCSLPLAWSEWGLTRREDRTWVVTSRRWLPST